MKKTLAFIISLLLLAALPASALTAVSGARDDIAIHEVNIEGLQPAFVGHTPEDSYTLSMAAGQNCSIVYQYWHDSTLDEDMFVEQTPFEESHSYAAGCIIAPDEGYYFADDCVFKMNGSEKLVDPEYVHEYYLGGWWVVQSVAMPCAGDLPGDVDFNGAVESTDALIALRGALGITELTPEQLAAADMNGDGECTTEDALVILRIALGIVA